MGSPRLWALVAMVLSLTACSLTPIQIPQGEGGKGLLDAGLGVDHREILPDLQDHLRDVSHKGDTLSPAKLSDARFDGDCGLGEKGIGDGLVPRPDGKLSDGTRSDGTIKKTDGALKNDGFKKDLKIP
jgi:hypothetical protein